MDWFLIKENEHLGPFNEETIRELFASGQCSDEDLVWRDGWSDARSYAEVFLEDDFKPLEAESIEHASSGEEPVGKSVEESGDEPPPLPPLPTAEDSDLPHTGEANFQAKNDPPKGLDSPKQEVVREVVVEEISVETPIDLDFQEEEFELDQNEKRLSRILRNFALGLIGFIIVFSMYVYLYQEKEVFERPKVMSLGDYERLVKVAKSNPRKLDFIFALASDKRTLWAATNSPLKGEVFVNLKSKKGRSLGRDVEVKAKGQLENNLITFSNFQFVQGTKFIDGYYDVEVYTVDDLEIPLFSQLGGSADKQFRFINEFLITSLNREDFNQQLKRFSAKKQMNADEFWIEISEKYRTVKSITEQIRAGFVEVLNTPSEKFDNAIKKFKDDYARKYGVFFTSFVQSNEESYERLVNKDFEDRIEVMAGYNELSNLSKKIGSASISLLEEIETTNPSEKSPEEWNIFTQEALIPFNLIVEDCERKLAILQNRI